MTHIYSILRTAIENNDNSNIQTIITQLPNINLNVYSLKDLNLLLTPLQLAVYYGRTEIVDVLLRSGADVQTPSREDVVTLPWYLNIAPRWIWQTNRRYTALHLVGKKFDRHPCIELLLAHGADYGARDGWDNLPLNVYQFCNNFPSNSIFSKLNLTIFGDINLTDAILNSIGHALNQADINGIVISLPAVHLRCAFLSHTASLFNILKSRSLLSIDLDISYEINTQRFSGFTGPYAQDQINTKTNIELLLQSLFILTEISNLQTVSLGKFLHIHNETTTKFNSARESTEIETTTTIKKLFELNNEFILTCASNLMAAKEKIDEMNSEILRHLIGVESLFESYETRINRKVLDSEPILSFCSAFALKLNNNATLGEENIQPREMVGIPSEQVTFNHPMPSHVTLNSALILNEIIAKMDIGFGKAIFIALNSQSIAYRLENLNPDTWRFPRHINVPTSSLKFYWGAYGESGSLTRSIKYLEALDLKNVRGKTFTLEYLPTSYSFFRKSPGTNGIVAKMDTGIGKALFMTINEHHVAKRLVNIAHDVWIYPESAPLSTNRIRFYLGKYGQENNSTRSIETLQTLNGFQESGETFSLSK